MDQHRKVKKYVIWGIVAFLLVVVIASSLTTVKAGHTGVVTTFGAVSTTTLNAGLHVKLPFVQDVIQMDNRTQKLEVGGGASSKDLQVITYVVALNYRINTAESDKLYRTVGQGYENIVVTPAVQESIKSVTARFTAEELIVKRQEVSDQIKTALSEKVNAYGLIAEVFNIVNFEFSDEFNKAVEAKQTAQQQALKAEQDLSRIKVEAAQKIEQAKAEAESIRLIQDMLANAPQYIEYIKWSKWDGKMPAVLGDNSVMLDLKGLVTPSATPTP